MQNEFVQSHSQLKSDDHDYQSVARSEDLDALELEQFEEPACANTTEEPHGLYSTKYRGFDPE